MGCCGSNPVADLLLAPQNLPFAVALCLMLGIAVLEGVLLLLGAGLSDALDGLLPDIDVDIDADSPALSKFFGWLYVGRVPALMLLVVFLTGFGLIGLIVQQMTHGLLGFYLPRLIAVGVAGFLALPFLRGAAQLLSRLMPGTESEAVSTESFIGRTATITLGTASAGSPAEARLTDVRGQDHYLMIEPERTEDSFSVGDTVVVVSQTGAVYKGLRDV